MPVYKTVTDAAAWQNAAAAWQNAAAAQGTKRKKIKTANMSGYYISTSSASTATITITGGTGGWIGGGNYIETEMAQDVAAELSPEERKKILEEVLARKYGNWLKLVSNENGQRLKITKDFLPKLSLELPDGHVLDMDQEGNFKIIAADAKVTYKANNQREFNRYINASDLLAQFIKDLGLAGATQKQVLQVPLELFINWLVIRSAEQDEEQVPDNVPKLTDLPKIATPRCRHCGRFLPRSHMEVNFSFCNGMHADKFMGARKSSAVRLPLKIKS